MCMRQKITLFLFAGLFSLAAFAQTDYVIVEDLTSKLLQNADFSADEAVTIDVRTYAKDMIDDGIGSGIEGSVGLYGQQPVTGWIAANPTDNFKQPDSLRDVAALRYHCCMGQFYSILSGSHSAKRCIYDGCYLSEHEWWYKYLSELYGIPCKRRHEVLF